MQGASHRALALASVLLALWGTRALLTGVAGIGTRGTRAEAEPVSPRTIIGEIDRLVVNPAGQLEGFILRDHTWVKTAPVRLRDPFALRPGDQVTVSGLQILSTPNRVLERVLVKVSDHIVLDDRAAEMAPPSFRGQAAGNGGFQPQPQSQPMKTSSPLLSVGANSAGRVDELALKDGSIVQIPSEGGIDPKALAQGEALSISGIGRALGGKKWISAMDIKKTGAADNGLIAAKPGTGKWRIVDSSIRHPLVTPTGQIDGELLADGTALRFPPLPADDLAALMPRTPVRAAGPETQGQTQVRFVVIPGAEPVIYLEHPLSETANPKRAFGPPGLAPDAADQIANQPPRLTSPQAQSRGLSLITERGEIEAVLRNPQGEIDSFVLENGTTVKTPRASDPRIADQLRAGAMVTVTGRGGHYLPGTGLLAEGIIVSGSAGA